LTVSTLITLVVIPVFYSAARQFGSQDKAEV
jgi:multidrug efflux pump subunit AcrB